MTDDEGVPMSEQQPTARDDRREDERSSEDEQHDPMTEEDTASGGPAQEPDPKR